MANTFNLNGTTVKVKTLDEAREFWIRLRDFSGLGASDMVRGCGEYRQDGVMVARVSYNGRMWTADGQEIPLTPKPAVTVRADLYESGYDIPTYLTSPGCPRCGRLYCYCPERFAQAEAR